MSSGLRQSPLDKKLRNTLSLLYIRRLGLSSQHPRCLTGKRRRRRGIQPQSHRRMAVEDNCGWWSSCHREASGQRPAASLDDRQGVSACGFVQAASLMCSTGSAQIEAPTHAAVSVFSLVDTKRCLRTQYRPGLDFCMGKQREPNAADTNANKCPLCVWGRAATSHLQPLSGV